MNRKIAPDIQIIPSLHKVFPESTTNLFRFSTNTEVFKLKICFPNANKTNPISNIDSLSPAFHLLLNGTIEHSAAQIAEKIDELGGYANSEAGYFGSSITLYGLNNYCNDLVSLVKNAYTNAIFPIKEIDIWKKQASNQFKTNLEKTSFLADNKIIKLLLGETHPNAQLQDEVAINSINLELLQLTKNTKLNNPYFIFTGKESIPIENILTNLGFEITNFSLNSSEEYPLQTIEIKSEITPKESSQQSSIRMGKRMPSVQDKDYYKIKILNTVLGGYFGSRLMKNIREEKGLTYGINSSVSTYKNYSLLIIRSECNKANSSLVKDEILKELKILQNELISYDELQIVKNFMIGSFQSSFDGNFNTSNLFYNYINSCLPKDYYETYLQEIINITSDDLIDTANKYYNPDEMSCCIVG